MKKQVKTVSVEVPRILPELWPTAASLQKANTNGAHPIPVIRCNKLGNALLLAKADKSKAYLHLCFRAVCRVRHSSSSSISPLYFTNQCFFPSLASCLWSLTTQLAVSGDTHQPSCIMRQSWCSSYTGGCPHHSSCLVFV